MGPLPLGRSNFFNNALGFIGSKYTATKETQVMPSIQPVMDIGGYAFHTDGVELIATTANALDFSAVGTFVLLTVPPKESWWVGEVAIQVDTIGGTGDGWLGFGFNNGITNVGFNYPYTLKNVANMQVGTFVNRILGPGISITAALAVALGAAGNGSARYTVRKLKLT